VTLLLFARRDTFRFRGVQCFIGQDICWKSKTYLHFQHNSSMTYEDHVAALEGIIRATGEILEGNCVYTHQTLTRDPMLDSKRRNLARAGEGQRYIAEIGFNAGHSALLFLAASHPESHHVFFDLGEHTYTRPCAEAIQVWHPEKKIHMVYGDSRVTIPRWIQANPGALGRFDVVHVDGGHTLDCATSDMFAAYMLTKPGGHIIVDDIQGKEILPAVNAWMASGTLQIDPTFEVTSVQPHAVLRKVV
jgi:hypothetical protein